jgi:hypothetical protein
MANPLAARRSKGTKQFFRTAKKLKYLAKGLALDLVQILEVTVDAPI